MQTLPAAASGLEAVPGHVAVGVAPTGRIVTVIFLEGGKPTFGPKAAELTGQFYRALWDRSYFQPKSPQMAASYQSTGSNP